MSVVVGALFLAVACVVAFWRGGPPERIGSAAIAAVWLTSTACSMLLGVGTAQIVYLSGDVAAAVVFLVLAIQYAKLWVGWALIIQAALLAAHAFYLGLSAEEAPGGLITYIKAVNGLSLAVMITLASGAVLTAAQWRRSPDVDGEAALPAAT